MGLRRFFKILLVGFLAVFVFCSCGYKLAGKDRQFVGDYRLVAVPIFKNKTSEPKIEVFFTNSLRRELFRAREVKVTDEKTAPITIDGVIDSVSFVQGAPVEGVGSDTEGDIPTLPAGAILTTDYRIYVTTTLAVRRNSDNKVLWRGSFTNERSYLAPQIGTESINSSNALYNQSARLQNIEIMAKEMMREAYNRMTENF